MIDDLLAPSQAGRIKGTLQVFDLIEAVATMRNDLVDLIQRKEATVLTEGSLPTVSGDQHRITRLLANLVTNGLKYNKHSSPQIIIGQILDEIPPGAPEDLDKSHALIYVRDNGIGIDGHFHQKIFGIFRRLHQPEEFEGTGAGLAICKKIVEAHGGHIWVESTLGQGATFYFTLPRPPMLKPGPHQRKDLAPPQPLPRKRTQLAPAGLSRVSLNKSTPDLGRTPILLVEDDVNTGLIIQSGRAKAGLDVTYFTNAEEAWDYLQSYQPELLLLDINLLPSMSGIDLCKKVRGRLGRTAVLHRPLFQ